MAEICLILFKVGVAASIAALKSWSEFEELGGLIRFMNCLGSEGGGGMGRGGGIFVGLLSRDSNDDGSRVFLG